MAKSIIAFDAGSSSLKMAVFSAERNRIQLTDFDISPLSVPAEASLEEKNRILARQMRASLTLKKVKGRRVLVCISGQSVFTRFVKLPAVEQAKVSQIIRYEAQQQVPFPIEDVEWDHYIIAKTPTGEIDIVLVAVKNDVIASFLKECEKVGLEVAMVDAAPLCLYNCLRHAEQEYVECTGVIDFGARGTNLIISEGDDLWARTIPIGGDNITPAIAKELNVSEAEAEKLKEAAWVPGTSAGEPPDATEPQRRIATVVDSFVNRLFAELSRSIGFYRSQPGHSALTRILLTGGGSRLKNFKEALSDRFKVDVGWLMPLKKVAVASGLDRGELNRVNELLAGVVGVGLRGAEMGRVRVNLLPKAIARRKELSRKKVVLIAAGWLLVASLCLMAFGKKVTHGDNPKGFMSFVGTLHKALPGIVPSGPTYKKELEELYSIIERDSRKASEIRTITKEIEKVDEKVDLISELQEARLYWADFIEALKETKAQAAGGAGQQNFIWLTALRVTTSASVVAELVPELGDMTGSTEFMRSSRGGTYTRLTPRASDRKRTGTDKRPFVIIKGYVKVPGAVVDVGGRRLTPTEFASKRAEDFMGALEVMGETLICSKNHRYREDKTTGVVYPVSPDTGPAKAYRYVWDEDKKEVVLEGFMEVKGAPAEGEEKSASREDWQVLASYGSSKKPEWLQEGLVKWEEAYCPVELAEIGSSRKAKLTRTGGYLDDVSLEVLKPPEEGQRVARFTIMARLNRELFYPEKSEKKSEML